MLYRRGPEELRSQPYRRRAGDCSRVLTSLRLVKPPLCHFGHDSTPITGSSHCCHRRNNCEIAPKSATHSHAGELLAPATKPASFCRSHLQNLKLLLPTERLRDAPGVRFIRSCRLDHDPNSVHQTMLRSEAIKLSTSGDNPVDRLLSTHRFDVRPIPGHDPRPGGICR
jgi:hypothetical protein